MNAETIGKLAELIYNNWNGIDSKINVRKSINGLFRKKKTINVIKEYKDFLNIVPKEKKKQIPVMTAILVLALCRRNLDEQEAIYKALKNNDLILPLYGGLFKLLNGASKLLSIKLKWNDNLFENKYQFIKKFQGEFLYWDYIEIFTAAEIIKLDNPKLFEELLLRDESRLLLLNIASGNLGGKVSDDLILKLLTSNNELDQNIGFFLLTTKLNYYIWQVRHYTREKELGINRSHSEISIVTKQISEELKRIESSLNHCNNATKASLIVNYLLAEAPVYPKAFAEWLLDCNLQDDFIKEIKESGKIKTLDNVYHLLNIVSSTRRKGSQGQTKLKLYNALVDVIISFIRERKGIYLWTEKEEQVMSAICKLLPKKPKIRLLKLLIKESEKLLCSRLDKLVRFDIYLKDKSIQDIINGMVGVLQKT